MGHPFDIVAQAVREIIHRVNAPPVASAVMRSMPDPVEHGVPQPNVRRLHVDLGPQRGMTVRKLASTHPLKEEQIFLRRASTKWTLLSAYPVAVSVRRGELVHIRLAFGDELNCVFKKLLEIVRGVEWLAFALGCDWSIAEFRAAFSR